MYRVVAGHALPAAVLAQPVSPGMAGRGAQGDTCASTNDGSIDFPPEALPVEDNTSSPILTQPVKHTLAQILFDLG